MMPQLGETVTEGTITRWMKAVGDAVERDEPLFEVSTDKVDSEVPSPAAGVLSEILVPEGETVEVGVKLAVIGDGAGAASDARLCRRAPPRRSRGAGGAGSSSSRPRARPDSCAADGTTPASARSGTRSGCDCTQLAGARRRDQRRRSRTARAVTDGAQAAGRERDQ